METVVLVIHLLIATALVGVIMVQRSEGGGLGIGGGGGLGGMMTARGTANLLTRTTAILAGLFMLTSVVLAIMANRHSAPTSLIDTVPVPGPVVPVERQGAPSVPVPGASVPVPDAAAPGAVAPASGPAAPSAPAAEPAKPVAPAPPVAQ